MQLFTGTLDEFIQNAKRDGRRLVCFGTGISAQKAVRDENLTELIDFFVDNDKQKWGGKFICGSGLVSIFPPERLLEEDPSHIAVMITSTFYPEITAQMDAWPELDAVPCGVFKFMKFGGSPESEESFRRRILAPCLEAYAVILQRRGVPFHEQREMMEKEKTYILGNGPGDRPMVISQLSVIPHNRCNLCCEGCAQLLPMFHNGKEFPAKAIIRDLEIFFRGVDQCIEICVDSEPFIYKELAELLRWLAGEKKVLGVHLITNSFAQPSKEVLTILSDKKFAVLLSDYGQIKQMGRMISDLEEAGINFFVKTDQEWDDWGSYELRGRTEMELRNAFVMCDANINCKALCDGAVYTCVRSARLHALGCGYASERDYFFLSEDDSIEELQSKIRNLFYYMDRADACDRCDAGQPAQKKIAAGKQVGVNKRMSAYTIIRRDEYERLSASSGGVSYGPVDEAIRRSRNGPEESKDE